jgi:hypothetical protein
MLKQGDIVTLDNNKRFFVVSSTVYNNKNYYYLLNEENNSDIMFCELDQNTFELVEVNDYNLKQKLILLFLK